MLQDPIEAAALIRDLRALAVTAPVRAIDQALHLRCAGHPGSLQRPGTGQQGSVLVTEGLGIEVGGRHPRADGDRTADHRDQRHGARDQPVRERRRDQLLEIPVQRLPVRLALLLGQLTGVAQVKRRKAAPVRTLFKPGGDGGEQKHRAHRVARHLAGG